MNKKKLILYAIAFALTISFFLILVDMEEIYIFKEEKIINNYHPGGYIDVYRIYYSPKIIRTIDIPKECSFLFWGNVSGTEDMAVWIYCMAFKDYMDFFFDKSWISFRPYTKNDLEYLLQRRYPKEYRKEIILLYEESHISKVLEITYETNSEKVKAKSFILDKIFDGKQSKQVNIQYIIISPYDLYEYTDEKFLKYSTLSTDIQFGEEFFTVWLKIKKKTYYYFTFEEGLHKEDYYLDFTIFEPTESSYSFLEKHRFIPSTLTFFYPIMLLFCISYEIISLLKRRSKI